MLPALIGRAAAGNLQPAALAEQTYGFHPWTIWSPGVAPGNFYLENCRPVLAGDVTGDGRTDLICPYDYGGGSTITFVLRVVVHYISLPLIMR